MGADGQADNFSVDRLRDRVGAETETELRVRRLPVWRHRVVDQRLHAAVGESLTKPIAIAMADDEQVPDRPDSGEHAWENQISLGEVRQISFRNQRPSLVPLAEMGQLDG